MGRGGVLFLFLLGACQSAPEPVPTRDEMRAKLKDPRGLLEVFQKLVRTEQHAVAWEFCLAVDPVTKEKVIGKEAYQLAMTNELVRPVLPRLLTGLEAHAVDEKGGKMRLCNPEFGVSRDFEIRLFLRRLWTFAFTPEDLDYFRDRALAWVRKQVEMAGHRHHVYPPDWKYSKVLPQCGCKKHG